MSLKAVVIAVLFSVVLAGPAYALGSWVNSYSLPYSTKLGATAKFGGNLGFDSSVYGIPLPSKCYIQIECPGTLFNRPTYVSGSVSSMSFSSGTGMGGSKQYVGKASKWITGSGKLYAYAQAKAKARGTGKGYVGTGKVSSFQCGVYGTMKVV